MRLRVCTASANAAHVRHEACTQTSRHARKHAFVHANTPTRMHARRHADRHAHTCSLARTHAHIHARTCVHTRTLACTSARSSADVACLISSSSSLLACMHTAVCACMRAYPWVNACVRACLLFVVCLERDKGIVEDGKKHVQEDPRREDHVRCKENRRQDRVYLRMDMCIDIHADMHTLCSRHVPHTVAKLLSRLS